MCMCCNSGQPITCNNSNFNGKCDAKNERNCNDIKINFQIRKRFVLLEILLNSEKNSA